MTAVSCEVCGIKCEKLYPSNDFQFAICLDCVDDECWGCHHYFDKKEIVESSHYCGDCQDLYDNMN